MTDEQRDLTELHEVDLREAGKTIAEGYHEMFAYNIRAGIADALDEATGPTKDIIVLGLLHRIHEALAEMHEKAAAGWEEVFHWSVSENYNSEET